MTVDELGQRTKAKHSQYASMSDSEVGARVLAKYPAYRSQIGKSSQPNNAGLQSFADSISGAMSFINNPGGEQASGGANLMQPQGDSLFNRAAGGVAEYLGGKGVNPYMAAIPATAISMANPMNWISPNFKGSTVMKPRVSPSRASAVSAAEELNIPLSRAEQTGSSALSGVETLLEKTPTGTVPINKFREGQMVAKQAALEKAMKEMGTTETPFTVGMKAKEGLGQETASARNLRNTLYEKIPQDVRVPLQKSISVADEIIQEQAKYLPTTRNADVIALAKDVQNASIPPQRPNVETSPTVLGSSGESQFRAGPIRPESAIEPNYPMLSRLRSVLADKIKQNTITQADGTSTMTQSGRDFMRLKSALDSDIESFASSASSPLESMISKEFKDTYRQANAFGKSFAETYQNPDIKRLTFADPEKVVSSIFKKNSESEIRNFRAGVGEEAFSFAKKRFTQDLLESKNIKNELSKYEPETLKSIYGPSELEKIQKLGDTFDLLKSAEKTAGNPSGTGRQILGGSSYGAAAYALLSGNPLAAASIIGLPYISAKALTSKVATREFQFQE